MTDLSNDPHSWSDVAASAFVVTCPSSDRAAAGSKTPAEALARAIETSCESVNLDGWLDASWITPEKKRRSRHPPRPMATAADARLAGGTSSRQDRIVLPSRLYTPGTCSPRQPRRYSSEGTVARSAGAKSSAARLQASASVRVQRRHAGRPRLHGPCESSSSSSSVAPPFLAMRRCCRAANALRVLTRSAAVKTAICRLTCGQKGGEELRNETSEQEGRGGSTLCLPQPDYELRPPSIAPRPPRRERIPHPCPCGLTSPAPASARTGLWVKSRTETTGHGLRQPQAKVHQQPVMTQGREK